MDEYILAQPQCTSEVEEKTRVTVNLEAQLAGLLVPGAILHLDKASLQSVVAQSWNHLRYDEETKRITRESWIAFKKHVTKYVCLIALSTGRLEVYNKNALGFSFEKNGLTNLKMHLEVVTSQKKTNPIGTELDMNLAFVCGTVVVIAVLTLGSLTLCTRNLC